MTSTQLTQQEIDEGLEPEVERTDVPLFTPPHLALKIKSSSGIEARLVASLNAHTFTDAPAILKLYHSKGLQSERIDLVKLLAEIKSTYPVIWARITR